MLLFSFSSGGKKDDGEGASCNKSFLKIGFCWLEKPLVLFYDFLWSTAVLYLLIIKRPL